MTIRKRSTEAEEVGCWGLVEGTARNLSTHRLCIATDCTQDDGPFYCPDCYSDAVIKKCTEKVDHFAHLARTTPLGGSGEGNLHSLCKKQICRKLQERYPLGKWETEREIPASVDRNIPRLIPDASGRINGIPLVIEVQVSAYTLPRLLKRIKGYASRKIPVLWIIPLSEPLGHDPFRPRLFERYLHSLYYGRVYYWWDGLGITIKPVHYGLASRHIEHTEWHDENGDRQEAGGYDRTYKIIKTPLYGRDLSIPNDFTSICRQQFIPENERKTVPSCQIWQDTLKQWW